MNEVFTIFLLFIVVFAQLKQGLVSLRLHYSHEAQVFKKEKTYRQNLLFRFYHMLRLDSAIYKIKQRMLQS